MPGLSFLFKKGFHPSKLENQKNVFIAEQTTQHRAAREAAAALEVQKERDLQLYESLTESSKRDPRTADLKFMYAIPAPTNQRKQEQIEKTGKHYEPVVDKDGEDDMVKQFKLKLLKSRGLLPPEQVASSSPSLLLRRSGNPLDSGNENQNIEADIRKKRAPQSALEKAAGRAAGSHHRPSLQELEDRHAVLKNAPVAGGYLRSDSSGGAATDDATLHVKHNPFAAVVRNVKCVRCGKWGHQTGDRACTLRDTVSARDKERQRREDPLHHMTTVAAAAITKATDEHDGELYMHQSEPSSDPEIALFLDTLSNKEKKSLLRKLVAPEKEEVSTSSCAPLQFDKLHFSHKTRSSSSSSSENDSDDCSGSSQYEERLSKNKNKKRKRVDKKREKKEDKKKSNKKKNKKNKFFE